MDCDITDTTADNSSQASFIVGDVCFPDIQLTSKNGNDPSSPSCIIKAKPALSDFHLAQWVSCR